MRSVLSPSRLTSPSTSPPAMSVRDSLSSCPLKVPEGTLYAAVPIEVGVTARLIRSHVASPPATSEPSVTGSVAVNVSTILRSPVEVFCSAGCARSTPLSRMPMVVPRPSQVGCWRLKTIEPVSRVGMNGLSSAVVAPGPPVTGGCFGPGWSGRASGSGTTSSRSSASIDGSATVCSTLPVGTTALK